jgi:hypothetical protein
MEPSNGKGMLDLERVMERERMRGFEMVEMLPGSTFKDSSTVIIVPARDKKIDHRIVQAWENLIFPMNQRRSKLYAVGDEVGRAYENMIRFVLAHPVLSKFKYVMTMEDDNLPLPDAPIKLLDSIDAGPLDAVSGLYFTKGGLNMPMAYGDPKSYLETGVMDFKPRDVVKALSSGNVIEVNGIAMGCAVWRMDLFREFEPPWFVTVNEYIPFQGTACITQDLFFCERLRKAGKRLGVDLRVAVGHMDLETGEVY